MRNRPIRIPNTALGTIWVECYEADSLHLHPWWHHTCRFAGKELPFFGVTLQRVKGRWTITKFDDGVHPWNTDAPKWPRGAREKVPGVVLEIGAAWAAANESLIRERGIEALEREVNV
jgi:hypothetical protein